VSILTLVLSTTSYSSDDDSSASIEGKWETTYEGTITAAGKEELTPVQANGTCSNDYIEFLKGGTFNEIIFQSDCTSNNDSGTWSKKDNKLTIKYDGNTTSDIAEIIKLNQTTLKLKVILKEDGQPDEIYIIVSKRI
jgi:hypothetical protein